MLLFRLSSAHFFILSLPCKFYWTHNVIRLSQAYNLHNYIYSWESFSIAKNNSLKVFPFHTLTYNFLVSYNNVKLFSSGLSQIADCLMCLGCKLLHIASVDEFQYWTLDVIYLKLQLRFTFPVIRSSHIYQRSFDIWRWFMKLLYEIKKQQNIKILINDFHTKFISTNLNTSFDVHIMRLTDFNN
jgi:hypothetical protein